ncbi:MAG: hypothetical protein U9P79_09085 [Candidatus Cloacimonadota bacterium]|nr:hypothetical protein [Candidatus Cloacimonadota bacterium]
MTVTIREVTSNKQFRQFINFPYKLYKGNKYWAPPIRSDEKSTLSRSKNPAFEYCNTKYWLAYKDGKIAGRIAGIHHKSHIEKWGKNQLRFGWIDFIDDPEVTSALLSAVENWARELKMESIIGPLGFTDLDYSGMLVEGFEELGTLATIYNYPYYPEYLELNGYRKDADWIEYQITIPVEKPAFIEKSAKRVKRQQKLRLVEAKKTKEILHYAKGLFDVINESYSKLYGVVPLSEKQIEKYTKQYIGYVHPDYIALIVDDSDNVVAFGVTMPSFTKALQKSQGRLFPFGIFHLLKAMKKNDLVDFYLIGIKSEYQGKGVGAMIMNKMADSFIKRGIKFAESNPELESNDKIQTQWKFFDKRQHKRRRSYIKDLN